MFAFFGISYEKNRSSRMLALACFKVIEDIPQIYIVLRELYSYGCTVNFMQAFNPIYAILMIYKDVAPFFVELIYRIPDLIDKSIFVTSLVFGAFFPIVVSIQLSYNMTKMEELPDILFEEGLYEREPEGAMTEKQLLAWIIAMPFIAISFGALTIYRYKRTMKNALEESMKSILRKKVEAKNVRQVV